MSELFRKTSLEKLSSPEQLDKMIVITPPSFWLSLAGAGFLIAAALIWAIFGKLPVNVETQGIYINHDGVYSVYSETAGVVEEIVVKDGDQIKKGDVIAYLNTDELTQKVSSYESRIENVEKITMDSQADAVTADNKGLIEIKSQMLTIDQNIYQNQELLKLYSNNVAAQRQAVAAAEQNMRQEEREYYHSLSVGDSTDEQLSYTEAQNELANASSYLEAAQGSLDQANVAYNQALSQYQTTLDEYNRIAAQESALEEMVIARWNELVDAYQSAGGEGEPDAGALDEYREDPWYLNAYVDAYIQAASDYENYITENQKTKAELEAYVSQYKVELDAAEETRNNCQEDVDNYSSQKSAASENYENAKNSYLNRMNQLGAGQNEQTTSYNQYNVALNDYTTEETKLTGMLDSLAQMEVQVKNDRKLMEQQITTIYSQFASTKAAVIDQLNMECDQYREQLEKCKIVSSVDGEVADISIVQGSVVNQGSELVKVQQGEKGENVVVCYVALNSGKKISEGMDVLVYPTTVNKQEYGHMAATVRKVDSYVTSAETLRTQLGNDSLVEAFLKDGPVVAVVCALKKDVNTSSGYYWSSAKGKNVLLAEGTLMEASVVLEEKAPITMLIPYIKEKLTIKTEAATP